MPVPVRSETTAMEADQVRAELRQFMAARPDLRPIDLVQYTTLSEACGRNFLAGSLPGGQEVVAEFKRVLAMARSGDILQPGGNSAKVVTEREGERVRKPSRKRAWYETATVRRVAEVLEFCHEEAAIGVITADFGVGKTEAVKAWRRGPGRKIDSVVFEFDEFSSTNKVEFVQQLVEALGAGAAGGNQNAGRCFRAICAALKERPCLLILDQCETVRPRVFQVIRQIWDRTHEDGVGVVLLAAPILLARMTMSRIQDLGALTSRVGVWAPLSGVGKDEMAAIVKREGITEVDEAAYHLWWQACGGSMRRLMRSLDLLRARHTGKRVTERTIAGLAGNLWGLRIEGGE